MGPSFDGCDRKSVEVPGILFIKSERCGPCDDFHEANERCEGGVESFIKEEPEIWLGNEHEKTAS